MFQEELKRQLHTKDIEMYFEAINLSIEQIIESEKGKLNKEVQKRLNYYYDITTNEHKKRLADKFPRCIAYINGEENETIPPHQDHWKEAKVGDIVRKTGWYYESNVENGNYYVVLEENHGDVVVLDIDGSLKTLCFPEEYELAGNTQEMLKERHEEIRRRTQEVNVHGWEKDGLDLHERNRIDTWLKDGKEISVLDYFTPNWKAYYDLGVEKNNQGFDLRAFLDKYEKE